MSNKNSSSFIFVAIFLTGLVTGGLLIDFLSPQKNSSPKAYEYKIVDALGKVQDRNSEVELDQNIAIFQNTLNQYSKDGWEPVNPSIDWKRQVPSTSHIEGIVNRIEKVISSQNIKLSLQSGNFGYLILRREI